MISLSRLKDNLLSSQESVFQSNDFLMLHRFVEAYLKRVLLIGLRLHGVQYEASKKIIEGTYLNTSSLINKCMLLLSASGTKQAEIENVLKSQYPDFIELRKLFLDFTSKYRNVLAHGLIDEIKDNELLDTLCVANKRFVSCFESVLKNEFGHSAFETPTDWGASRGHKEDIEKTISRLKLGSMTSKPMTLSKAKETLSKINGKDWR